MEDVKNIYLPRINNKLPKDTAVEFTGNIPVSDSVKSDMLLCLRKILAVAVTYN